MFVCVCFTNIIVYLRHRRGVSDLGGVERPGKLASKERTKSPCNLGTRLDFYWRCSLFPFILPGRWTTNTRNEVAGLWWRQYNLLQLYITHWACVNQDATHRAVQRTSRWKKRFAAHPPPRSPKGHSHLTRIELSQEDGLTEGKRNK